MAKELGWSAAQVERELADLDTFYGFPVETTQR